MVEASEQQVKRAEEKQEYAKSPESASSVTGAYFYRNENQHRSE